MKIEKDLLRIQASPFDSETGEKLEPEAMPAERVYEGTAPVSLDGVPMGEMRVSIGRQGTAHEFANQIRGQCVMCKHWDRESWVRWKQKWEGTPEGRAILQNIRKVVLMDPRPQMHEKYPAEDGAV